MVCDVKNKEYTNLYKHIQKDTKKYRRRNYLKNQVITPKYYKNYGLRKTLENKWCRGEESNFLRRPFQGHALLL